MESQVVNIIDNTSITSTTATTASFDYPIWILFSLFVAIALALDLGLLNRVFSIFKNKNNKSVDKNSKEKELDTIKLEDKHLADSSTLKNLSKDDAKQSNEQLKRSSAFKHALLWTIVWISLSMVFAGIIYAVYGHDNALLFLTGYAIEKSLSMDNLFVFLIIFSSLGIPYVYQHKVLMAGILSAIFMRIVLILAGGLIT
jgi:integral membrane protein TerC family protein